MLVILLGGGGFWVAEALRPVAATPNPAPTLIVLGAAQYNGKPSPIFKSRLDHAAELYRKGGIKRIIIAGGVGEGAKWSEGNVGRIYLVGLGLPPEKLVAERRSRSTLQNLENAAELLPTLDTPITIVTDEIHAPRALAVAQDLGLNVSISPSPLTGNSEYLQKYRERERWNLMVQKMFGNRFSK